MNVRERLGLVERRSVIDRLFDGSIEDLELPTDGLDVRSYVELALESGFPELVDQTSERARRAWLAAYVDQVILRDAPFSGHDRDPQRLRAYLGAIAASSAEVVTDKTLHDAAGITRTTGQTYDNLLELLFVTERVPAYTSNRLRRLTRAPKRYVVDPGLLAPLLRVDARAVVRDARLVGQLIDTFVAAQLRSELAVAETSPAMFHLRQADGRHEADLVLEGPLGRIVAIEVKAHSAPTMKMARHLEWLRDELGDQFALGVLFHTGPRPFEMADRLWALPISALWG
jgi:predicted AAA+ superfamily ATPase